MTALDLLKACEACTDTVIVQCTDCVVFPRNGQAAKVPGSELARERVGPGEQMV